MPPVLLLLALVGGGFKIFAAEISGKIGPFGRGIAGVLGSVLVLGGLLHWFDPRAAAGPEENRTAQGTDNMTKSEIFSNSSPSSKRRDETGRIREEQILNVSGHWVDNNGTDFSISQVGENFTFRSANQYNGVASSGSGVIRGHQFTSSFQTSLPSMGRGSGSISDDGRTILGNFYDSSIGQYALTLVKR